MEANIINIHPAGLFIGLIFIFISGAASVYQSLGLEKDLFVGTIRTFSQLFLLGYILKIIFDINHAALVLLAFFCMTFFAALTIKNRVKEKEIFPCRLDKFKQFIRIGRVAVKLFAGLQK